MVPLPGESGQLASRRRVVQYVNLGVLELLPPKRAGQFRRDVEDGQLRIITSLRVRHDFGTFQRNAEGRAQGLVQSIDGRQIDVLFGYLEGERLGGWVDLRVGRQFEMSGLDWYVFDGGWLRVRTPARFAFETFVGLQVDGTAMFGYPTFELDGTHGTASDHARTPMVGAAVSLADLSWVDARVAYRRTASPSALNPDVVDEAGARLNGAIDQELVSGTFALRLLDGRVSPYSALRYELGTARMSDLEAGVSWAITPNHFVRAMYMRTMPLFDLDSVFNVFAMSPFEDARLLFQVHPSERWTLSARGQARIFQAEPTGSTGARPGEPVRVGWGGGASAVHRRPRFAMRFDLYGLTGEGGTRIGGSFDSRTHVLWDRIALDGRAYAVGYRDEQTDVRHGYAVAMQAGANIRLIRGIQANVMCEEMLTSSLEQAFRVLAVFSVDWSFRAGPR